ncbi:unnamed protein product, partial [Prorocentrum cordatum]
MPAFDEIPRSPILEFDLHIDETCLSKTAYFRSVVASLVLDARTLHDATTVTLGCELAMDKIGFVTSRKPLSDALEAKLRPLAGAGKASVVNLGIDFAAGKPIRSAGGGRGAKLKARLAAAAKKSRRLARLSKAVGRKATKMFAAGPLAGGVFGPEVYGTSDRELLTLRRMDMSTIKT